MARPVALVDTGPLYAAANSGAVQHSACVKVLKEFQLIVPTLVVAEATYFVGSRLGPEAEARFLAGMSKLEIEPPAAQDWERMAELVRTYGDFPLGGTDASVIAAGERLDIETLITLDRRRFSVVRPTHRDAFHLLP
ncbi:MAG TPA: PIN domain-containing protein [Chloroflexota bacterium]|nr:PIN domain-containing protein [Chloroflexota bacterium]